MSEVRQTWREHLLEKHENKDLDLQRTINRLEKQADKKTAWILYKFRDRCIDAYYFDEYIHYPDRDLLERVENWVNNVQRTLATNRSTQQEAIEGYELFISFLNSVETLIEKAPFETWDQLDRFGGLSERPMGFLYFYISSHPANSPELEVYKRFIEDNTEEYLENFVNEVHFMGANMRYSIREKLWIERPDSVIDYLSERAFKGSDPVEIFFMEVLQEDEYKKLPFDWAMSILKTYADSNGKGK